MTNPDLTSEFVGRMEFVGGPAFPTNITFSNGAVYTSPGMSLRDYFAGQALTGAALDDWGDPSAAAKWAYAVADAMIAARAK